MLNKKENGGSSAVRKFSERKKNKMDARGSDDGS
jgi:hypothetical protein